jgi:glycosyltransferase involved in cell wall biosynthesis
MTISTGATRSAVALGGLEVTYIGFLLGHGGDALQMLSLAEAVQSAGGRVKVIVPAVETSVTFADRCRSVGVECERSELITVHLHGASQSMRSVIRLLWSVESPVVHFHTGNSCLPSSVMAALEMLRYRPAFVTLQSPYETIVPGSPRARFWAATARRRFLAVASPSEHGSRFQLRCGVPERLAATIRNSIDTAAVAGGDGSSVRRQLALAPDAPLVLFSSRIDPQKRPVDAVRMFGAVAVEFPTAVLVFVGGGEEEVAVAAEADRLGLRDRVRFAGYQTNIPDWLAAADVWLLPTERENFSVAVLEALAAGCPVVSTTCPGNDEVLVDGENSRTFAIGDIGAGAAALRDLMGDPALRERVRARGRETAAAYTVDRMAAEYLALYARHPSVPASLPS